MTSRLEATVVDCADPATLARFWAAVLGYEILGGSDDLVEIGPGGGSDEQRLDDLRAGPVVPALVFVRVPERKAGKNRLHFDVSPIDSDQAAEVERLRALGARISEHTIPGKSWVVMLDPEGNEFDVVRSLAPGHFEL